jgi:hypothetical protein
MDLNLSLTRLQTSAGPEKSIPEIAGKTGNLTTSLITNPLSNQKGLLPFFVPQPSVKLNSTDA